MNDKKLLEYAAKAAGRNLEWGFDGHIGGPYLIDGDRFPVEWNPLEDDGDALRLVVMLRLTVSIDDWKAEAWKASECGGAAREAATMGYSIDKATRRAIVRAAADLDQGLRK